MLVYLWAVLGAIANAVSSVLQRHANRSLPEDENLSWRLIRSLLHRPSWFGGIVAVTAGFLLQAVALSQGALASVEPIFILELGFALLIGSRVFHVRLHLREWGAVGGMTVGLAVLLYLLAPTDTPPEQIGALTWVLSIGLTVAFGVALVALARMGRHLARRSALLGVAAGVGFGLTASLIKAMTDTLQMGLVALLTSWPLYAVIACGVGSFFVLQSAYNAGPLVAAQPGVTLTDPIVSIVWGVTVYGEQVNTGPILIGAAAGAVLAAVSVFVLVRSPMWDGDSSAAASLDTGTSDPQRDSDPRPDDDVAVHR